jgi:hypothetical protein
VLQIILALFIDNVDRKKLICVDSVNEVDICTPAFNLFSCLVISVLLQVFLFTPV